MLHSPGKLKNLLKLTMVKLEKMKTGSRFVPQPGKTFKIYTNKCMRHSNSVIKLFPVETSIIVFSFKLATIVTSGLVKKTKTG